MIMKIVKIEDHEWIPNAEQLITILKYLEPEAEIADEEFDKFDKFIKSQREDPYYLIHYQFKCAVEITVKDETNLVEITIIKINNPDKFGGVATLIIHTGFKPGKSIGLISKVKFIDESIYLDNKKIK